MNLMKEKMREEEIKELDALKEEQIFRLGNMIKVSFIYLFNILCSTEILFQISCLLTVYYFLDMRDGHCSLLIYY